MSRLNRRFRLVSTVAAFLSSGVAYANPNDALQLTLSYSITHDNNLFRLSDGSNTQAAVGRDSAAEIIKAATTGISFVKDYGLQHVELRATAINYDYMNFSYLNFTAYNFSGLFKWSITPRIRGVLSSERRQSIAGFEDFKNYNVRNENVSLNSRAEAIYELDGAWQLVGSVLENSVKNTTTIIQQRAFTRQAADIGIKRTFSSGSEVAFRSRRGTGRYTDDPNAASNFLPAAFTDTENELQITWLLSDKSRLDARVAHVQRNFNDFSFRNYSGFVAESNLNLGLTKQVELLFGVSSVLSDYQTTYSNTSQATRFIFAPSWQVREKVALKFRQEYSERSFDGSVPGFVSVSPREDTMGLTRVSVEWRPRDFVSISAWLQKERRKSNFTGFDYTTESAGVTAQGAF